MSSLDRIVFARRQSPDWEALARDHEAGQLVDPVRYMPPPEVPGFPPDLPLCIRTWNNVFPVNFFRCRAILKRISEDCLGPIGPSVLMSADRLSELAAIVGDQRFFLFFFDDDDWFAPDIFARLTSLDLERCEIAVFPLVRFGNDIITFVREGQPARVVVGAPRRARFRYYTNNYALSAKIAFSDHAPHLRDHILGSRYGDRLDLGDTWFDAVISATNKTPCAGSSIRELPADPVMYREAILRYADNLRRVDLPLDAEWMAAPLRETSRLFDAF
ncbi:MAG: hypothetical protein EXR07_19255 [Acetobacteraceae bacterium]|nr:hypothetical protein [Acetobacteraceae bacterium]